MKKYFLLSICLFFASLNFNLILKPLNLVTGGTQGLAILLHLIFPIPFSSLIFGINFLMLGLSYFLLPKETTKGTIAATFLYPLFIKITSFFSPFSFSNYLVPAIISGIVCGLTGGWIYHLGFSSGGITVLNLVIQKYFHIPVSVVNFIGNAIIILLGCCFLGIQKGLYSFNFYRKYFYLSNIKKS